MPKLSPSWSQRWLALSHVKPLATTNRRRCWSGSAVALLTALISRSQILASTACSSALKKTAVPATTASTPTIPIRLGADTASNFFERGAVSGKPSCIYHHASTMQARSSGQDSACSDKRRRPSSASSCGATRDARSRAAKALIGPFLQQYLLQRHFVFPGHAVDLAGAVSAED